MGKKNEIKDQSTEELKGMLGDLSKDIFQMKNEIAITRKLDKPHVLREKKRDRARVLTLLNKKGTNK